jgi:putative peptidoglycan lipid II flippase
LLFVLGSALELLLLLIAVAPRLRTVSAATVRSPKAHAITLATAAQFALLSVLPSVETFAASISSAGSAAEFNYAVRSLAIVQQLIVGGVVIASLGDWSSLANAGRRRELGQRFLVTLGLAFAVLVLAACVAAVCGRSLVALVYERGAFSAQDTSAVTRILFFALCGFCAESLSLVIGQAILALRQNAVAVTFGLTRFVLRLSLVLVFAYWWGAVGVAAAYSVASVAVVGLQLVYVARVLLEKVDVRRAIARPIAVVIGTATSATAVGVFAGGASAAVRGASVVGAFMLLSALVARRAAAWRIR